MLENLLLVGSGDRRLRLDQPRAFADLVNEPLVLPSPKHGLRVIVDACAARVGVSLTPEVEADAFGAMIELVKEGFGCTVLPLAPIFDQVQRGVLSAAPLVDPTPSRKLIIAYPMDRPVSPATRYVGETFATLASDLVARGVWHGRVLDASAT